MNKKTKTIMKSLGTAQPYLYEWTEVSQFLATGLSGNYERKEVSLDWDGPVLDSTPMGVIQDKDKALGDALIAEIVGELNTSDLNVCYTGDLKEETDITAVALAISTLKMFFPITNAWNGRTHSGVLRYLESKITYTNLEDDG